MKSLVISLLRLGDILLHRELAKSLKRQHPGCQVHFLIHSQFSSVQNLIPEVDVWHHLDRNQIQKILVEQSQSPLQAYELLTGLISKLNAESFDLVLNATHNRFSVRIMDLIRAGEKRGATLENGRRQPFVNPWQRYFNENFSESQGSRFHYLQVLHNSLGLEVTPPSKAARNRGPLILLQLLTSDTKKNWGLQRFRQLRRKLQQEFPAHRVLGLCSPQESGEVQKVFQWNEYLSPTLEEAANLLKESCLLITGDTSIQHLAAQQECPVLSLFLGSADPVKTLPWQNGAYLLQGASTCFPCRHSEPCMKESHLCAEALSVDSVFNLACGILRGRMERVLSARTGQARMNRDFFFPDFGPNSIYQMIEQWVWGSYLNQTDNFECDPGLWSDTELARIQKENDSLLETLKSCSSMAQIGVLEERYANWKDSFIRLKRDPQGLDEALKLCHIRAKILVNLRSKQEVRDARKYQQQTDRVSFSET
jgi:ADP-heptose:LPS heptosyltransferase